MQLTPFDSLLVFRLKTTLAYPRPPLALPPDTLRILGEAEAQLSFPSGEAAFAGVRVAGLRQLSNRTRKITDVVFLPWIALSRISFGAHWAAGAMPIVTAVRCLVDRYLAKATRAVGELS